MSDGDNDEQYLLAAASLCVSIKRESKATHVLHKAEAAGLSHYAASIGSPKGCSSWVGAVGLDM